MRKSIMDKVFDVLAEENRRFARLQEQGAKVRKASEKPELKNVELIEAKRLEDDKKDFLASRCS